MHRRLLITTQQQEAQEAGPDAVGGIGCLGPLFGQSRHFTHAATVQQQLLGRPQGQEVAQATFGEGPRLGALAIAQTLRWLGRSSSGAREVSSLSHGSLIFVIWGEL
jgi:hypothetical protein